MRMQDTSRARVAAESAAAAAVSGLTAKDTEVSTLLQRLQAADDRAQVALQHLTVCNVVLGSICMPRLCCHTCLDTCSDIQPV